MPETTNTCPKCGNQIEPGLQTCPSCGAALAQPGLFARLKPTLDAILATTKTHKWYWIGGGGGALIVAAALVMFFSGILGPSGKAVCTATLNQAKDFGVISMSAELASSSAESTGVKDRRQCTATADGNTYNLTADVKCKDLKKPECLALYSVARTDGMTTYQVREIPPNETDEAIEAQEKQAAAAGGQSPGAQESDNPLLDTDTAVDNSGGPGAGNAGQSGQP